MAPGEFIFSGSIRHDKLNILDVLIHFASERHAGFRDYHIDPGSTTRRDIQQQIISGLRSNDASLVVLFDRPRLNSRTRAPRAAASLTSTIPFI